MRVGILVTHIRAEEKLLIQAFQEQGVEPEILLDRSFQFDLTVGAGQLSSAGVAWSEYDLIVERCVSTSRGLYALALLNSWDIPTINSYETASICADKIRTSIALARANVPQPQTQLTFEPEQTLQALEEMGYPSVLKPATGSWGRLLARINDRDSAEAILEHRQTLGDYNYHVYYTQEYINKPQRDIRAFVIGNKTICAIYRESPHWITNTARGGKAYNCPITPEIDDLCQQSAQAVGGGILAIDLLEDENGNLLVNEVNHTMEFRNSSNPTGVNIPGKVVQYALNMVEMPV